MTVFDTLLLIIPKIHLQNYPIPNINMESGDMCPHNNKLTPY